MLLYLINFLKRNKTISKIFKKAVRHKKANPTKYFDKNVMRNSNEIKLIQFKKKYICFNQSVWKEFVKI